MKQPIPPDLHEVFQQVLSHLHQTFGEDIMGAYALVTDTPAVITVIETAMTPEQRSILQEAQSLHQDIALTVFTKDQLQQGHPYESDFSYDPSQAQAEMEADDRALANTGVLRVLRQHGVVLAGLPLAEALPIVPDDEYRVVLRHEAQSYLAQLTQRPTLTILHLCRILAFWRIGLLLLTEDAGSWSIKNLDPRFQSIIERASVEYHSGAEPGAYNSYQLEQFAEYVRDMLRR